MAYIGYFRNTNSLFHVLIRKAGDNSTPTEITLSGEHPFVVRYEESETPFDPIRNSTATINIVSPHYFEDVLPSKPYDTEVILFNETYNKTEWVGYLTPKIYSQAYEDDIEVIELEASDILSSLQYVDYQPKGAKKIETFDNIIGNCIDGTLLKGFVWSASKGKGPEYIYPSNLKISEMNFFSNDTEEAWKCQDVLSEMCKYLGFTAIQYEKYLYLLDYDALKSDSGCEIIFYTKNSSGDWYGSSYNNIGGNATKITQKDIMGSGGQISFEPVYNKIVVKDNFYTCDTFIRNIFDDEFLTNRGGSFYSSFEVEAATTPGSYPWGKKWGKQKYVNEEKLDTEYRYFHRLYDHKYYDSVYRTGTLQIANVSDVNRNASHTTKSYVGGTIMDLGRVSKNTYNENLQDIIPNKIEWERYLCICQRGNGMSNINSDAENMSIFRLKQGTYSEVMLNESNYLIIDFKAIYEKYQDRNYINPDWTTDTVSMGTSGHQSLRPGNFYFILGIGGKFWDGREWRYKEYENEVIVFEVEMERPGKFEDKAYINEELSVLNNVSWELNIEEPGYKIPLNGVNTTGEIVFEFLLPRLQIITEYDGLPRSLYNGYCWVKDFSIKTTTEGQSIAEEENDIVYENVIDEVNVNDMDEIDLKFTTAVEGLKPSYSNVIYEYEDEIGFLGGFREDCTTGNYRKAEEHIVERYYNQYSTPTKKITHTLGLGIRFTPLQKYCNVDIDNPNDCYTQLGCEIDYAKDRQEITFIQRK